MIRFRDELSRNGPVMGVEIAEGLWPPIAAAALTATLVGLRIGVEVRRARTRDPIAPREPEVELPL